MTETMHVVFQSDPVLSIDMPLETSRCWWRSTGQFGSVLPQAG